MGEVVRTRPSADTKYTLKKQGASKHMMRPIFMLERRR